VRFDQGLFAAILAATIVIQALTPSRRLLTVLAGAAVSCTLASVRGVGTAAEIFSEVPWDVLLMLVALGLFAEQVAASRLFGVASVWVTRGAKARPGRLLLAFVAGTYVVSGLVNNLTALLMVLPVLLSVFRLVGASQRYTTWTVGLMLVACNLGGAATPIGDFPAVLLLGRGAMGFGPYLAGAAPPTFLALLLLLVVVLPVVRPAHDLANTPVTERLTLATLQQLYRGVRLDWRTLAPTAVAGALMLLGWLAAPASWGLTPEIVCWLGAGAALLTQPRRAERLLRTRVDVEAALFLLALFLMVGVVRRTGLFTEAALALTRLPVPPTVQVVLFLVVSAVFTGLFSAGPSMAALLEVAEALGKVHAPSAIYIGLALAVCAGSSLFLTAATSGPLSQALVERSHLQDARGAPVRFGFREFLPVGLAGFSVILVVAVARTLWALGR